LRIHASGYLITVLRLILLLMKLPSPNETVYGHTSKSLA
jgi:hypothetical protein